MARIADDSDFEALKRLVDNHDGWTLELSKSDTEVYTRPVPGCNFNMVKIHTEFADVTADIVFDVLHDPDYRKVWDSHMLASEEIGILNVNNDVGYYAMSCPPPLKPRDFVLQRSWLDTGPQGEQMLLSRSVPHKNYPPKKGYVRAMSYITGFVLRTNENSKTGCILKYVAHCDPQGTLPPWLVNKVTHTLGPRMVKDLKKAALGYPGWKLTQPHLRKPWRFPEEIRCPRISIDDCLDTVTVPLALPPAATVSSPKSAPSQQQSPSTPQPPAQRKLPQLKTQTNGRVLPILHKKAQSTPSSPVVEEAKFPKRDDLKELLEEKRKDEKKKQKDAKEPKGKDGKEGLKSSKELEKEAKAAAKESKKLSKAAAKEAAAAESALAKKEKKEKGLTKRRSLLNLKF
ncbi:START domain-containing protein 10-like [Anopheles arabiensis]|uniref:START domain-containing protein 10 n=3 Tax=gambiae species complex TaxID=44542 RepID=A0A1S4GYK5_ANOGA|nr:START domain-containing protein 10-like [Anopheles arabiensis]XP_061512242.1 START domain-containing protein 10 [Anopheles gambiae]